MSSSALPPPGNLPSWSRVSAFDRSRYPRPFLRDRAAPADLDTTVDVRFLEKVSQSVQHRFASEDKSIKFLQDQHSETLQKLHQELETLKKENKELKFKVVLAQASNSPVSSPTEPRAQSVPTDIKTILLEEEIKDLRQALKDSSTKNAEFRKMIISLRSKLEKRNDDSTSESVNRQKLHRRRFSISNLSTSLPLHASLNPLQVRDTSDSVPRVPSMAECELIIQQLHSDNCQHIAELSRLRADRQSVTSSGNTTPEPHISKSFHQDMTDRKLPRIPVKPKMRKPIRSASLQETTQLPIVITSSSANLLDRRKFKSKTLPKNDSDTK